MTRYRAIKYTHIYKYIYILNERDRERFINHFEIIIVQIDYIIIIETVQIYAKT